MSTLPAGLSGTEVHWEGTDTGFVPHVVGYDFASAAEFGSRAIIELLEALLDRDTFVLAHVVLTKLTGIEYQTFPEWNHLTVSMAADGAITIDPEQRFDLARRWKQWYQAKPRPSSLPQTTEG